MTTTKRIVIVGATSGLGHSIAQIYCKMGWRVGIAGRRVELLEQLQSEAPSQFEIQKIDVTDFQADEKLNELIQKLGGMDIFLLCSGIGSQNRNLQSDIELRTVGTNTMGFTRMVDAAYHYFKEHGGGQLAVISSIAGTKGLGVAPAYSATKRFQNTYIDAIEQLTFMEKIPITFTDIRPGFVKTELLRDDKYPLLMEVNYASQKIVNAIQRKRRRAIIDWKYQLLVFFWKLIPNCIWKRLPIHT